MTNADGPPEQLRLAEGVDIPNHPTLPVLIYRTAAPAEAATIERLFTGHGWPAQWRDGIFAYHHYHARGHEVLGIARGHARVQLGGPGGPAVDVAAGDVLVLPAGTGHCRLDAGPDLLVVGAYPPGQTGDIRSEPATVELRADIARLDFPDTDPVRGPGGPLTWAWRRA